MQVEDKKQPKSILWHRGYSLRKDSVSKQDLLALKKELTVQPKGHPDYPVPDKFSLYVDGKNSNYIRLPRYFGENKYGVPERTALTDHPRSFTFRGQLRDYQTPIIAKALAHLRESHCGIMSLYTSWGKTYGTLFAVAEMGQRCIILVHKSELLLQWKSEIENLLPDAKVDIIQGTRKTVSEDCDITLAMIQTVINMDVVPPMFGLAVVDECHHVAAETFSTIFSKVTTLYALGITATVNRKDGLTRVLNHYLGPIVVNVEADVNDREATVFFYRYPKRLQGRSPAEKLTHLVRDEDRNERILRVLETLIAEDTENVRKLLIFSDRREHAALFHEKLTERQRTKSVGLYLGGMKSAVLAEEKGKDIICSTYNMFGEGLSVKQLNTLVLLTPKSDVCQIMGRIFRQRHAVRPWIVDIVDEGCEGKMHLRQRTYRAQLSSFESRMCGLASHER